MRGTAVAAGTLESGVDGLPWALPPALPETSLPCAHWVSIHLQCLELIAWIARHRTWNAKPGWKAGVAMLESSQIVAFAVAVAEIPSLRTFNSAIPRRRRRL
jgi:hypothetical protein